MTERPAPVDKHIDKLNRVKKALSSNPLEWIHIARVVFSTFLSRFVFRCVGAGSVVGCKVSFINPTRIKMGKDGLLADNVYLRAGADGYIHIGDDCAINSYAKIFGHGGVTIGNNSQVGPSALITTTSHDIRNDMKAEFKKVTIKDWAWVGANATILPGITVGHYAVVGAGSIVTKDVPDFAIVVGNPAKVIGENEKAKAKYST
ncbi:MAG: acyltransferase [Methylococcaceae bacterium]